jgi:hypothetical protein
MNLCYNKISTGNLFLHGPCLYCLEDKRSGQWPFTLSSIIIQSCTWYWKTIHKCSCRRSRNKCSCRRSRRCACCRMKRGLLHKNSCVFLGKWESILGVITSKIPLIADCPFPRKTQLFLCRQLGEHTFDRFDEETVLEPGLYSYASFRRELYFYNISNQ